MPFAPRRSTSTVKLTMYEAASYTATLINLTPFTDHDLVLQATVHNL